MIVFTVVILICILIFTFITKKKCKYCGSRKIQNMPYETGSYCENCYQRNE